MKAVERAGCAFAHVVVPAIAVVFTLASCHLGPIVDRSILTDSPCSPPCWQGITPGTAMEEEEIVKIVEGLPAARGVQTWPHCLMEPDCFTDPKLMGQEVMWWWRSGPDAPPSSSARNVVLLKQGIVQKITLQIEFELTLEEVLDWHGIPEHTDIARSMLTGDQLRWTIHLSYPTKGIGISAVGPQWNGNARVVAVEPAARVYMVTYFVPAESVESWLEDRPGVEWRPWPGFGEVEVTNP
jgi:hypothetical protein